MRRAALLAAAWLLAPETGAAAPPASEVLAARLDARLPVEMAERRIPGALVVVVDREGIRLRRAYGVADLDSGAPVDPQHTTFRAASVSKLVTATAAMQLVEQGILRLDGASATQGIRIESPFEEPIQLRHLLTHTAGFGARFLGYAARTREGRLTLETYLAERLPRPFVAPGRIYSYANHGIALAGLMMARATGRAFPETVDAALLGPLGMGDSSFDPPSELLARLATGYVLAGGELHPVPFDFQHATPPGGLVTTGTDMARFLRLHLSGGEIDGRRILRAETVAAMQRRQFSHHPRMRGVGFGFHEYETLGWRWVGHDGDTGGFNARALLVPELGLGLFLAYTGSDQTKRFAEAVTRLLLEPMARPARSHRLPRVAPSPATARLAGLYRWTRYDRDTLGKGLMAYPQLQFRVEALEDGALRVAPTPLPVFPTRRFEPVGDLLFQAEDDDLATFLVPEREASGGATHLLFDPSGVLPMAFERIPWWRGARTQLALLALFAAAWPASALALGAARLRGRPADPALRGALTTALAAALANGAFLFGFPAAAGLAFFGEDLSLPGSLASRGIPPFFYGPSPTMLCLLALPLLALVLEAALAVRLARAWRRRAGSGATRWALAGLLLLGLGFAAFLHEWNLLGYRL